MWAALHMHPACAFRSDVATARGSTRSMQSWQGEAYTTDAVCDSAVYLD